MITRILTNELKILAKEFPAVAILGPRQSGKTTLAKAVFSDYRYISLEDPDIRAIALEDPRGFINNYNKYVIFDEIQRVPELLSYLQTHIDKINIEGAFILTGSHNYLLMENISQSLAGRVGITTLLPFSYYELHSFNLPLNKLLYQGCYPRIYDKNIRPTSFYQSYLNTYIERDVRLLRNITDYNRFEQFLRIVAGRTGQLLNTQAISEDCGISHNTINDWITILETSYIVFRLLPFHKNYNKRLIKHPKIYFYDTGLVCYLLGIKDVEELNSHYFKGNIFETYIISEYQKYNYNKIKNYNLYFWRDNHRKEIDLIIEDGAKVNSIEIKSSETYRMEFLNGLKYWINLSNNDPAHSYLVYAGDISIIKDSINILSWRDFATITT